MNTERYSMSFTTGSLFHRESVQLALLFLELNNWDAVRERVLDDNLMQSRTLNARRRICSEVISRLKTLTSAEIELLAHGTAQEQRYLLWIAICRRYKFIHDFAVEVVRERYISLKTDLHYEDFDSFLNMKSHWHEELENIHPVTRKKTRQVLFKILREAELLNMDDTINVAILPPRLLKTIPSESLHDLLVFPFFESDLVESKL